MKLKSDPGGRGGFKFSEEFVFGKFNMFTGRLNKIINIMDTMDKFTEFFEGRVDCESYFFYSRVAKFTS